jgi:hypothetical protein
MGTSRTDCEELITAAREEYAFLAHVPYEHPPVGNTVDRDAPTRSGSAGIDCAAPIELSQ